jgi:hypothetical protein
MKNDFKSIRRFALAMILWLLGSVWILADGQLATKRYEDPKGYYVIVPPVGWRIQEYPQDPRGKVAFTAPDPNVDLRILINAVDFTTIDELVNWCKDVEKKTGLKTNIERIDFYGRQAVKRSFETKGLKLFLIDFLVGSVDHNIQFGAPVNSFQKYLTIISSSIETYEAKIRTVTSKEMDQHFVAKKTRLAQLMIENGNLDLAFVYVKEGLAVSPDDQKLLELKRIIESKKNN